MPATLRSYDRYFGMAAAAVGVTFVLGSLACIAMNLQIRSAGGHAVADVNGRVSITASDGPYEVSMLRFNAGGREVRVKSNRLIDEPQVPVVYPLSRPEDAREDSFAALWATPLWIGAFGVVMVSFGVWILCRSRREGGG